VNRTTAADSLETLARDRPEFRPWLRLLGAARSEIANPDHADAVPERPPGKDGAPRLDGAMFAMSRRAAEHWLRGLLTLASAAGAPASLASAARSRSLDALAVIEAAIGADRERLEALADAAGAERAAFAPVAAVAAMPLLHACGRRWAGHVPPGWDHGYCPICGAWPALAEARGLERERRLRCARCGGDWRTEWLRCPFCANRDHLRLGALVPEGSVETRKAETCAACRRYVKTVTTLQATPAAEVAIQDLATVDLDVGALASGYQAPPGLGHPVRVRISARARWPRMAWTR
jgi:FdhE protein